MIMMPKENKNGDVTKEISEIIKAYTKTVNEEIKGLPPFKKVEIITQYIEDWNFQPSEINYFFAQLYLTQNEREQARIAQNRENVSKKPLEVIEGFAEIANEEIKDVPSWEKVDIVKRYVKDWKIHSSEINYFLAHLHLTQNEGEQVRIAQNRAVKPEIAPKPIRKAPKPPQVQNAGLGQPQSLKNLVDRTLQGKVLEQNNAKSKNCSRRMDPYQRS